MLKTKWVLRNNDHDVDRSKVSEIMDKWGVTEPFAKIMLTRGIEDIENFIAPSSKMLHNPFLFNGMAKAVDRIINAINNNEKITVYGDYDVDGISATTIILTYFRELGYDNIGYYIPIRNLGYGINKPALKQIAEDGTKLLITVDCGITAQAEIDYANELGLEVIVTDHHEQEGELPNALAVLDPKSVDSGYPFTGICGTCVAYKLMLALHTKLENKPDFSENLDEFFDFVAFATIADVVPLTDENRYLVKKGLSYFSPNHENKRLVFQKLIEAAGYEDKKINSTDVGFKLAPRINAVGRISDPAIAINFFNFAKPEEMPEIVNTFNNLNSERQSMEVKVIDSVLKGIPPVELYKKFTVVLAQEEIHTGIKGLVAGKICESYHRPTVVFSESEDGTCWEGSGRSIEGFDIKKAFSECSDLLVKFGGHTKAGGLTIKKENLKAFQERFEEIAKKYLAITDLVPCFYYDAEVRVNDLTNQFIRDIELFEPYGEENAKPYFVCRNAIVLEKYLMGAGKQHLRLKISQNGISMKVIAFNMADLYDQIELESKVDILGTAEENEYQGIRTIQIHAKDIKLSDEEEEFNLAEPLYDTIYFDVDCPVRVDQQLVLFWDKRKTAVDVARKVDDGFEPIGSLSPKMAAKVINVIKKYKKIYYKVIVSSIEYMDNRYNVLLQLLPKSRV